MTCWCNYATKQSDMTWLLDYFDVFDKEFKVALTCVFDVFIKCI